MPCRRDTLALLGSVVIALPGCLTSSSETAGTSPITRQSSRNETSAETPRETTPAVPTAPLGESLSIGGADVTVTARLQRSVVVDYSAWMEVVEPPEHQFLVVGIDGADDPGIDVTDLTVTVDGSPYTVSGPANVVGAGHEIVPVGDDCDDCAPYSVPIRSVQSTAVVHDAGPEARWVLDEDQRAFERHAAFELRAASAHVRDGTVTVDVTVANVGDRDGTFRALVAPARAADLREPVWVPVPAGKTRTATFEPPALQDVVDRRSDDPRVTVTTPVEPDARLLRVGSVATTTPQTGETPTARV